MPLSNPTARRFSVSGVLGFAVLFLGFLLLLLALGFLLALDAHAQTDAAQAPPSPVTVSAGSRGFRMESVDGDFLLRLRGDVQVDGRFFPSAGPGFGESAAASNFYVRRTRLKIQGQLAGRYTFKLMPNFGFGLARLQDAYLGVRFAPGVNLRAGKFKQVVSLEFLQSADNLFFPDFGYPSVLAPRRDVGAMLHGSVFGDRLDYAIGFFDGAPDGGSLDVDTDTGKEGSARLFGRPFGEGALSKLGVGVAGSYGEVTGGSEEALPGFRTPGRQDFFAYRSTGQPQGTRWRLAPQATFLSGPVGLLAEYTFSRQSACLEDATTGEREPTEPIDRSAWQVSGGAVLTGETQTFGRLVPHAPFGGFGPQRTGGLGALELVARAHSLGFGADTFPRYADPAAAAQRITSWGAGLNWYLNANLRITASYEQSHFTAAPAAPPGTAFPTEHLLLTRIQVSF